MKKKEIDNRYERKTGYITCKTKSCTFQRKSESHDHGGKCVCKQSAGGQSGSSFDENVPIEIHGTTLKYVSRGGLKLEKAMNEFDLNLDDDICMDIGASTGGFYGLYAAKRMLPKYTLWMSDMVSLHGNCVRIQELYVWKRRISVM